MENAKNLDPLVFEAPPPQPKTVPPQEPGRFDGATVIDLSWANAEKTVIACTVLFPNHPTLAGVPVPFNAMAGDSEQHGRDIFAACVAAKFGEIGTYVPPDDDKLASSVRQQRNQLLQQSDWTQLPDVPDAIRQRWATYRQELRAVPSQTSFPQRVIWPELPDDAQ